jgi:anaerobic ribonucleoside-triphosphate reductase
VGGVGYRWAMKIGILHRIRRQVLWVAATVAGLAVAAIVLTAVPTWPVIGAAVMTIAVAVQGLGRELKVDSCKSCGTNMAQVPRGTHGAICPTCGAIHDGPRV